jgi:hypothetical protein
MAGTIPTSQMTVTFNAFTCARLIEHTKLFRATNPKTPFTDREILNAIIVVAVTCHHENIMELDDPDAQREYFLDLHNVMLEQDEDEN